MKIANTGRAIDSTRFTIRNGTLRDYLQLSEHHYKAGRPYSATAVFVMHDREAIDVVARFKCGGRRVSSMPNPDTLRPIGVLVRSYAQLACQLRDLATRGRYGGLDRRSRASMINREVRVISRVVIDPRYRGLGLAVRLVQHALAKPETIYTEALAAMGRVNPFFEKAGMTKYAGPPRPEHARMLAALAELALEPHLLASPTRLAARLDQVSAANREWFEFELRRWVAQAFRISRRRQGALSYDECLARARDHLLARCVYYLHRGNS